jgi:hypothetical protein
MISSPVLLLWTAYVHIKIVAAWSTLSPLCARSHRSIGRAAMGREIHFDFYPDGEVVGSTGKIGSYILYNLNCRNIGDASQQQRAYATPRGASPGCLSRPGSPIYACITSSSIEDVWDATISNRKRDLVSISHTEHLFSFAYAVSSYYTLVFLTLSDL